MSPPGSQAGIAIATDFTTPRNKQLALGLLAMTQFVMVIDASIVSVALPSDLGAGVEAELVHDVAT
jgi:hypothetical protein